MLEEHRRAIVSVVLVVCIFAGAWVGYDRYKPTAADPMGSSGYTWFVVMHDMRDINGQPTMYVVDSKPSIDHGVVSFEHNGNEMWVSHNWSMYRMQNR